LLAYWDVVPCGPNGRNANWRWCDEKRFNCHKTIEVDTTMCASGKAVQVMTQGSGNPERPVVVDGCHYAYIAEYECDDTPVGGLVGGGEIYDGAGTWAASTGGGGGAFGQQSLSRA
jgi:hypothetical protein